jgi:hypothetical protein
VTYHDRLGQFFARCQSVVVESHEEEVGRLSGKLCEHELVTFAT